MTPELQNMIAPGEFSFCPRCGKENTCVPGPNSRTCLKCQPQDDITDSDVKIDADFQVLCIHVHKLRMTLAEVRREAGYKEKWWLDTVDTFQET